MRKVFVVQRQLKWDDAHEQLIPKFDLTPAQEFGELVYLLGPSASPFSPGPVLKELREKLEGITSEDYVLLIGNPSLIGWAVAVAASKTDNVIRMLQWCNRSHVYREVIVDLKKTN